MEYLSDGFSAQAFWKLVRGQHWVVAHWQLIELGLHPQAIKRRLVSGRLHRIWPGVYAVGRPDVSRFGRWMAAILVCGEGAALGGESAATLADMGGRERGIVEVIVPPGRRRRIPGIRASETPLAHDQVTSIRGITLTSPARTLVDLAKTRDRDGLEDAIGQADQRGLIDPETLRKRLDGFRGVHGVAHLRRVLDRRTFVLTHTQLERYFLPIAREVGLVKPEGQQWINGYRVDFFWRDIGLLIETDGLTYHRTPAQQSADLVRMNKHIASGLWPLRFSYEQVRYDRPYVKQALEDILERIRRSGTATST